MFLAIFCFSYGLGFILAFYGFDFGYILDLLYPSGKHVKSVIEMATHVRTRFI